MKDFRSPSDWRRSSEYQDATVTGQFIRVARDILQAGKDGPAWQALAETYGRAAGFGRAESFAKGAVASVGMDLWGTPDGQALSTTYLRSLAQDNLVDQVARFAVPLPVGIQRFVTVATGAEAHSVNEGAAKPLTRVTLDTEKAEAMKVVATLVLSAEVAKSKGQDAENLFRLLLRDAVIRASNDAVLARISKISAPAGATAVESLNNGLAGAAPSSGYVVAATPAITRELAMASQGRMAVNGGEYIGGVVVLPALEASSGGPDLVVIPASTLALRDYGLELSSAGHASVEMSDSPSGNSATPTGTQMVNLWQANLLGLKIERLIELRAPEPAIEVG